MQRSKLGPAAGRRDKGARPDLIALGLAQEPKLDTESKPLQFCF